MHERACMQFGENMAEGPFGATPTHPKALVLLSHGYPSSPVKGTGGIELGNCHGVSDYLILFWFGRSVNRNSHIPFQTRQGFRMM